MNNKLRSILGSLLVIGVVASMLTAGTFSYFSDTEITEGTFSAGTIDIELDPEGAQTVTRGVHTDLKPCQVGWINISVTNNGTNPLDLWKHIMNVENYEGLLAEPEEEYYEEWELANPDWEAQDMTPPWEWNMSDYIIYDMYINDEVEIDECEDFRLTNSECPCCAIECKYIYIGVLEPGERVWINQSYHLHPDVGNWAQGDYIEFDIEFFAQQVVGDPPLPEPQLEGHAKEVSNG